MAGDGKGHAAIQRSGSLCALDHRRRIGARQADALTRGPVSGVAQVRDSGNGLRDDVTQGAHARGSAPDCVPEDRSAIDNGRKTFRTSAARYRLTKFNAANLKFAYAVRPSLSISCLLALHHATSSEGLMFICVGETPDVRMALTCSL